MKNNLKKILAVGLLLLVLVLGGASIYVATRVSAPKPIAPTAPESKPQAAGENYGTDARCGAVFTIPANPTWTIKAEPDCPPGQTAQNTKMFRILWPELGSGPGHVTWNCLYDTAVTPSHTMTITSNDPTNTIYVGLESTATDSAIAQCSPGTKYSYPAISITPATPSGNLVTFGTAMNPYTWYAWWKRDGLNPGTYTIKFKMPAGACCTKTDATWSEWGSCSKVCGTGKQTRTCSAGSCGGTADCSAIDGGNAERDCNTLACDSMFATDKEAYKDESGNKAGVYTLTSTTNNVSKDEIFVYRIRIENNTDATLSGVKITDRLNGENQDILTFMDADNGCSYTASDRTLTCDGITIQPKARTQRAFRVKVGSGATNGAVIKNTSMVTYQGTTKEGKKDVTVSSVVGCKHTCTTDAECSSGLVCDETTNSCRKEACTTSESCVCPTATATQAPTTPRPTRAATEAPTEAPTETVAEATPTILPETGILDIPGVAAFGGGLILAVVGILLAL